MTARTAPVRARQVLAALTAVLIGLSGAVAFAAPAQAEATAIVAVTPATDIDTTQAASLVVTGTGFVGTEPVQVALVTETDWSENGPASIPLIAVVPDAVTDGAFEATLEVPAGTLDPTTAYGVATFAAVDRGYDTFTALTLAALPADGEEQPAAEEAPVEQVESAVAPVVEEEPALQQLSRVAGLSTVTAGNVTGGSAAWGLSTYLNSANMGRPNPLASAYVAPASFDAVSRISSWGNAIGTVNADGSATLAFDGTSVNFAPTGGGWLRLSDLEVTLDASGNGSVTAVAAYGTAPGAYPNITYNANLTPTRDPERVTLVTLAGNTATAVRGPSTASWPALNGTWSSEFTTYLAGDAGAGIPAWSYATVVTGATGRTPLPFAFTADVAPVATATTYDRGTAQWGTSTYLASANMGRPNPLASAYVAPATFDATTRLSAWGAGTGTVNFDGSATLAFKGTSVNFAPTGGGWLTLTDVQASLDASGNGVVSAIAAYGTAPGVYPNIVFNPAQTPTNGPARVTIMTLSGNATPVLQGASSATWAGLSGAWSSEFQTFLAGSGSAAAWAYASTVSSAAGRTPLAFTFDLGITPPAVATTVSLTAAPGATVVLGTASTFTATVSPAAAGSMEFRNGSTVLGTAPVAAGVATFNASGLGVGDYAISAHFAPADPASFTASQSAALSYSVTAPVAAQAGSLIWGVKASLRSYVLGGGSIATTSGAGVTGSSFLFPQESSSAFDQSTGTGTSSYRGTVTFKHIAHEFSIALSNPRVRVDSATSGSIVVDVTYNGATTSGVNFATLSLGSAAKSSGAGSTTFSGVPASLTAAGASAFQGFYSAGDSLDPVTFVVGSPAPSFASTIAAASVSFVPPATPPATEGIQGDPKVLGSLKAGDRVTFTASGFQPNETGIAVVIYSTPTILDSNATADAQGVVTWTGVLPAGLTGKHTLTFQGSVDRGIVLDIAPATRAAATGCTVDDATLTWGFKESFRSYISGSIANGEWTVADGASYEVPNFGWPSGTGSYDPEGGLVDFVGSVNFTGHGGILNTTVSNPQIRFIDADSAMILVDISGTTQDGAAVDQQDVEFVEVELTDALTDAEGIITVTDAPTTLTAAGAAAFGTYPEGEPFDAVSFVLTLDPACAAAVEAEVRDTATVTAEPVDSTADLTWVWMLIAAVLLLIAAAVVTILVRRRRTAE